MLLLEFCVVRGIQFFLYVFFQYEYYWVKNFLNPLTFEKCSFLSRRVMLRLCFPPMAGSMGLRVWCLCDFMSATLRMRCPFPGKTKDAASGQETVIHEQVWVVSLCRATPGVSSLEMLVFISWACFHEAFPLLLVTWYTVWGQRRHRHSVHPIDSTHLRRQCSCLWN